VADDGTTADPVSVWQGEMPLMGVTLHVHVLDNGQRIIEAADMHAFMEAMASGGEVDQNEVTAFARWLHGLGEPDG
jgi:hypothetical protein